MTSDNFTRMVMSNAPSPMVMNTLLSNQLQMTASGMVTG